MHGRCFQGSQQVKQKWSWTLHDIFLKVWKHKTKMGIECTFSKFGDNTMLGWAAIKWYSFLYLTPTGDSMVQVTGVGTELRVWKVVKRINTLMQKVLLHLYTCQCSPKSESFLENLRSPYYCLKTMETMQYHLPTYRRVSVEMLLTQRQTSSVASSKLFL